MTEHADPKNHPEWERSVIEKLAFKALDEQKRTRRWGIFFKFLTFAYLVWILMMFSPDRFKHTPELSLKHTAVVNIEGMIADKEEASADEIIKGLQAAFEDKGTKGIILKINSPGGSPVQAGMVYDEISRLRKKHPAIKVYAVAGDLCASAAYYIASAADFIYADKASLVGSIGVLMDGFGFVGTMAKLGVERRLLTTGDNKGLLDPFSPQKPEDVKLVKGMMDTVFQQFMTSVKKGRGARLKNDPEIFSGLFWTGEQALPLGVIDGFGSPEFVAREVIGHEKLVDYTVEENWINRVAKKMGAAMGRSLGTSLGLGGKLSL